MPWEDPAGFVAVVVVVVPDAEAAEEAARDEKPDLLGAGVGAEDDDDDWYWGEAAAAVVARWVWSSVRKRGFRARRRSSALRRAAYSAVLGSLGVPCSSARGAGIVCRLVEGGERLSSFG